MRVCELISRFRTLCRAELDDATLASLASEVEGLVHTEVLLLDLSDFKPISYPAESERELTVPPPHDKLYLPYLTAMAHFWCGDYVSYENQSALFNTYFAEYQRYISRTLAPARGECEQKGYYISAYSIAVKHGFEGSEAEWNEAVSACAKEAEAAALSARESAERAESAIESVTASGRELLDSARAQTELSRSHAESAKESAESAEKSAEAAERMLAEGINRLRGRTSGRAVNLYDISPVSHNISVKVSCDDADRLGQSVKLYNAGKNFVSPQDYLKSSNDTTVENDVFTTTFSSGTLFFNAKRKNAIKAGKYTITVISQGSPMSFTLFCYDQSDKDFAQLFYTAVYDLEGAWSYTFETSVDFVICLGGRSGKYGTYQYKVMLEAGEVASEYEEYIPHTETDALIGESLSVPSSQRTTFYTDSSDVTLVAEYERDVNFALQELKNAIISLGGNI